MTHRLFGLLALAVVATLALPAYAQQTPPSTQPGQPQAEPSEGIDQPQQQQAIREGEKPGKMAKQAMESPEARAFAIAKMMSGSNEEVDRMQFQALDSHLQMLDRSVRQIQQLSSQPEDNAAEIARWSSLRDLHARGIEDVVAGYFLSQRMMPLALLKLKREKQAAQPGAQPGAQLEGPSDAKMQQFKEAYQDQLRTAHEILAQLYLVKLTSDPQHVQDLRQLTNDLRQGMVQYNQQVEARLDQLRTEIGEKMQQAGRPGEPGAEPGIDQPEEQRAQREGQGQAPETQPPATPGQQQPGTPNQ